MCRRDPLKRGLESFTVGLVPLKDFLHVFVGKGLTDWHRCFLNEQRVLHPVDASAQLRGHHDKCVYGNRG